MAGVFYGALIGAAASLLATGMSNDQSAKTFYAEQRSAAYSEVATAASDIKKIVDVAYAPSDTDFVRADRYMDANRYKNPSPLEAFPHRSQPPTRVELSDEERKNLDDAVLKVSLVGTDDAAKYAESLNTSVDTMVQEGRAGMPEAGEQAYKAFDADYGRFLSQARLDLNPIEGKPEANNS